MEADLEARFAAFGRDPAATELDAALLVARLLDPTLDEAPVRGAVAELAAMARDQAPWALLGALGFRGNVENYEAFDNSHIGKVVATRRGLPITLAVLLIEVARGMGRMATGINFPGHFLVAVDGQFVDPFVMAPLRPEQALARLPPAERKRPVADLFPVASAQAVALRMLNNLKGLFAGRAAWHRALDAVDAQLAVAPGQAAVQLERGELWLRMGSVASARMAFEAALALLEDSGAGDDSPAAQALRLHLQQRLAGLRGSAGDVIH
jgi:regulator of sirC expression with transglutaminase-like and TPR domain